MSDMATHLNNSLQSVVYSVGIFEVSPVQLQRTFKVRCNW